MNNFFLSGGNARLTREFHEATIKTLQFGFATIKLIIHKLVTNSLATGLFHLSLEILMTLKFVASSPRNETRPVSADYPHAECTCFSQKIFRY